jgi:hypothetical protein
MQHIVVSLALAVETEQDAREPADVRVTPLGAPPPHRL